MSRRAWVRLDNASNIFLAAMSDIDSKVFRVSAELDEDVDPVVLQQALDRVFDQYVLYHAVLRRGIFWYYLEESDLRPTVLPDVLPPCDHLYHFDRRELLFRVIHHRNRIILELLHALSDGTGAMWVFQDLVNEYVRLRHPDQFEAPEDSAAVKQAIERDAFAQYFRRRGAAASGHAEEFVEAARSASVEAADRTGRTPEHSHYPNPIVGRPRSRTRVHRIRGTRAPDNRTRFVELQLSVADLLPLARQYGVSLTIYLTAVFLDAVRTVDLPDQYPTLAVSVPVNLRQHFPSNSGRNFFATTRLEYTFTPDAGMADLCRSLDAQLRAQTTPAALEAKLLKLVGFELHPIGRMVPRPIKDVALRVVNHFINRNLTVAISNLGRAEFAPGVDAHVGPAYTGVSAARPQFCMMSHGDRLTVTFTSPFVETEHQTAFVRTLTAQGVPVTVAASRASAEELKGAV